MKRAALVAVALALPLFAIGARAAEPVADDKATKDDYALDSSGTTAKLKVKGEGPFVLKITPKNGKKVHPDTPLEVTIVDNPAIKPTKQKLGRSDLKEKGAKEPEVATTLRGMKAGPATLEVNVSFFLCTDAWCQRMSDRVQIPIIVEE
ncbi:MAG: hypothetical protein Q8O67_12750 [Deltaproteobacteria bacterium]|nr:hypothetical protein [Deltaproteobacteria bacterium]